jgi:hypothetical protein
VRTLQNVSHHEGHEDREGLRIYNKIIRNLRGLRALRGEDSIFLDLRAGAVWVIV